ncbi:MAG: sigma-70 family RNA polymerase sigma factor [Anaerolineales bacterium]|nr:sigma-70 family RNA polymerase sigma factor [Anaerolineales bacterium]
MTINQELSLVRRSRADVQAFGALYDHYYPRIYNYVYYRVRDAATADDLVSTIFMRTMERLHSYKEKKGSFGVWVFRIAHNIVIDHYRSVGKELSLPLTDASGQQDASPNPEQALIHNQRVRELMDGVAALPAREQEIIGLKFGGGLTNRKIAGILKLKENHVAVLLYRAMKRLSREMTNSDNERIS